MKKLLAILVSLATTVLAQVGTGRSIEGVHVPSAITLERGLLFVSGTFGMVNDGNTPSLEGYYTSANGSQVLLHENTPSVDGAIAFGLGILENLEVNLRLPFHYDGYIAGTELQGFGLGDIQFGARTSFYAYDNLVFGASAEIIAPNGFKKFGIRPRHRWFIDDNGDAYAFSAGNMSFAVNAHASLIYSFLHTSLYLGFVKTLSHSSNILTWGTGVVIFPKKILTPIIEISGETPVGNGNFISNFLSSPVVITPGLRLRLPENFYLTLSGDLGLNYFTGRELNHGTKVNIPTGDEKITFTTPSAPDLRLSATLSKKFDFSWIDTDGDGVMDREDMCPNTKHGMTVNNRGCPVDDDEDGVLNIVDQCPGTLLGLKVDYNGCPLDLDNDGVFDYLDQCLGTPAGFAVDAKGCILDSDNDGVDDNNDKCPNSQPNEAVDETGCPLDEDKDGIINSMDKCPNTPKDVSIDINGCPLDFDKDGVPDDLDKCPNSAEGEAVDETGCPADEDKDGVPDVKDNCPGTVEGVMVDEFGCRVDQDGDGVFDDDDKCNNTPAGAPIDSVGCPLDSDGDGIADWYDQCPGSFKNVMVDSKGCPTNSRLNFNDIARRIQFKGGDTTFYNSSYTALNDVVASMRQYPIALEIECAASKQDLADQRALQIFNYLEKKGISPERLQYKGYQGKLPKAISKRKDEPSGVRLTPYTLEK